MHPQCCFFYIIAEGTIIIIIIVGVAILDLCRDGSRKIKRVLPRSWEWKLGRGKNNTKIRNGAGYMPPVPPVPPPPLPPIPYIHHWYNYSPIIM